MATRIMAIFMICFIDCVRSDVNITDIGTLTLEAENVDGAALTSLGEKMNSPLLQLVGHAFTNFEDDIHQKICQTCDAWSPWTACSAGYTWSFGIRSRSRHCWHEQIKCNRGGKMTFENESTVCIGKCPQNFTYSNNTRVFLRLHTDTQTKQNADTICQSECGYLLNTDTQERLDAAVTLMKGASITTLYIDGERTVAGGSWRFTNGVDPEKNSVPNNWHTGEPSNGATELCKVFEPSSGKYFWYDRNCDSTFAFVCEMRA